MSGAVGSPGGAMRGGVARPVAVLAGVGAALALFGLLAAAGGGLAWWGVLGDTRAERALAALLVVVAGGVLACAAGGWLAARLARERRAGGALAAGLAVGALTLLLLVALVEVVFGGAMDFRSAGIALGWVEIPDAAVVQPPVRVIASEAGGDAINEAREIARRRTVTAAGYWAAVAVLALGAATLGGLAAPARR